MYQGPYKAFKFQVWQLLLSLGVNLEVDKACVPQGKLMAMLLLDILIASCITYINLLDMQLLHSFYLSNLFRQQIRCTSCPGLV